MEGAYGGMAEWLKAAVLKTVEPQGSVGSNPTSSAMNAARPDRSSGLFDDGLIWVAFLDFGKVFEGDFKKFFKNFQKSWKNLGQIADVNRVSL